MTFLQRYEDFYGQYRQKFEDTEVPKALATLSADARRRVENGEGEVPIELLAEVRDGELEEKQKIATMTAIAGTWSNAASDTYWHAGPVGGDAFSERVGIGLMHPGGRAFTPLLKRIEVILDESVESPSENDALEVLAFLLNLDAQESRKKGES